VPAFRSDVQIEGHKNRLGCPVKKRSRSTGLSLFIHERFWSCLAAGNQPGPQRENTRFHFPAAEIASETFMASWDPVMALC